VLSFVGSTNILTILAAQGLGLRLIVSERNDPVLQSIGKAWDALRRLLYRRADLVVANSRAAVDAMRAYVPGERLLWLPNPLRMPPSAGPEAAIALNGPFLLAVGRLSPAKGHDLLLTAFAQIHSKYPDLHLAILGDGRLREPLETQARALGIGNHVHFRGFVADPFPWYRAALALIHPARFEGLPNVVLEAMSVGLPVAVSSAQAGLRDFVRDGETGLVVAADEPAAFAAAMSTLTTDAVLRSRLAAAGREAVEPCRAEAAIRSWSEALGLRVST
jgi:glycosyltransferase involved in cell wall biosynthesis